MREPESLSSRQRIQLAHLARSDTWRVASEQKAKAKAAAPLRLSSKSSPNATFEGHQGAMKSDDSQRPSRHFLSDKKGLEEFKHESGDTKITTPRSSLP